MSTASKFKSAAVLSLNAFALVSFTPGAAVVSDASLVRHSPEQPISAMAQNAEAIPALRESWLQVPATCKARGFNADPLPLASEPPNLNALRIFQHFGALS